MKVYIDVTKTLSLPFITGIQRSVFEYCTRLVKKNTYDVILLFEKGPGKYQVVDNVIFCECYESGTRDRSICITKRSILVDSFMKNDIFLVLDSCWGLKTSQEWLLTELKKREVKIITYIYDIIAITEPQFMEKNMVNLFVPFVVSHFVHSDLILCSTQFTIAQICEVCSQHAIPKTNYGVVPLGADIVDNSEGEIREDVARLIDSRNKYIIFVSTIEPRKNHKLILDAFDANLYDMGVSVVFVGRSGWMNKKIIDRIESHSLKDKGLYHFQGLNDKSLHELYNNAFLVAYPSYIEGFGMPAIEGMIHGVPTIHSDIPVMHEVVSDFGDYVNPDNPYEFIEHVKKYLNKEYYAEKKRKIEKLKPYSWDDAVEILEKYIGQVEKGQERNENNMEEIEIDVKKITEEIKANIALKRENNIISFDNFIEQDKGATRNINNKEIKIEQNINALRREISYLKGQKINFYHEITSFHKTLKPITIFVKRCIRKLCKFIGVPIVDEINDYHTHTVRMMECATNVLSEYSLTKTSIGQYLDEHKYKQLAEQYLSINYQLNSNIKILQQEVENLKEQISQINMRSGER